MLYTNGTMILCGRDCAREVGVFLFFFLFTYSVYKCVPLLNFILSYYCIAYMCRGVHARNMHGDLRTALGMALSFHHYMDLGE